ncbi:molybdate ABC transporter substrate-binding protein [Anaerosoma tenue]|uniref:molybdate ABC transporter substrate-binding protein n=1 Tax=Anaerosoma tenue TaxID=2933588 RepID=UPI002260C8CD|nr:molybdate ABC transporter substrate-binding protein [Anaerosoma tenue]MCK8115562.1 molybdate ABC transporter substrate-binding protein [Anaerosoma tenue]
MLSVRTLSFRAIIALMLAVVLTACVGCAGQETAPETTGAAATPAEPDAADDLAGQELSLFVAAGMKKPMDTVITEFQEETGAVVLVNYGSSGELYAQIDAGQPADLYYSADWLYIEKCADIDKVAEDRKFLRDTIVLVVSPGGQDKVASVEDLAGDDVSFVIGDPAAPAGVYAEQGLRSLGLWEIVSDNLVARPSTVNQVAIMVKEDQVDAGMVYSSVANGNELPVVQTLDPEDTGEIVFGAAVIDGGNEDLARAFMDFASERVEVFTAYGWEAYE